VLAARSESSPNQGRKSLTVIANDTARPGVGIGLLIAAKAMRKVVVSHIGTNPETQRQIIASELGNDGKPRFLSNHAGGILGGISTGQPVSCSC
jgi:hypothetical protein